MGQLENIQSYYHYVTKGAPKTIPLIIIAGNSAWAKIAWLKAKGTLRLKEAKYLMKMEAY